ncbi:hypothetical protein GF420_06775 [candidate division GN15 bacterium]|nr:hypothetical protein [candidate division GN15 bacterium]
MLKRAVLLLTVLSCCTALFAVDSHAQEETKPIQLALLAPVQLFDEDTPISGIRLNLLYGRNTRVSGLDWGLVNHTTEGQSMGVQFGLVGIADDGFLGWQDNFVNITKGDFEGFQWGAVNYANNGNGLQLGLVNYARTMKGLQIGLINIIKQGGQFPVFPIVNWSF